MTMLGENTWEHPECVEDYSAAAKACLLRSNGTSVTMYDHLVEIMRKVLEDKPDNVDNLLKEYSRQEKKSLFIPDQDTIQGKSQVSQQYLIAEEQKHLFERRDIKVTVNESIVSRNEEEEEEETQLDLPVPDDIMENAYFFELAGIGLGREETLRIFLAIKQLSDNLKLKSCRFWGKIFCINQDYIVAEVEFNENEDPYWKDGEEEEHLSAVNSPVNSSEQEIPQVDEVPQSTYKAPPVVPNEDYGEGCNNKVYYVCNNPGATWTRLPPVTPKQIQYARQIKKYMTGDLEAAIVSYPPFPGNECNYLRAQIARISASTHVSPQGYYIFEEDEEDVEDEGRTDIIVDREYEPIPVSDLCDPSFTFWVHHRQYVHPQGRTTWVNPNTTQRDEDAEEEESEDDEREEPEDEEPEVGPPLLAPLSEDEPVDGQPPWTAVKSTNHFTQYAIAVLHSNLWPGAHVFAYERKFENIYLGYGLKYEADNFNPQMPPALQEEYPSGPDITEAEDPTVEQERAVLAARKEAMDEDDEADESEDYDEEEG